VQWIEEEDRDEGGGDGEGVLCEAGFVRVCRVASRRVELSLAAA
jgi:hypothetical protein